VLIFYLMFFTIYVICALLLTFTSYLAFKDNAFDPIIESGVYTKQDILCTLFLLSVIPIINLLTVIYIIYGITHYDV
jgi:hypothetical protein